MKITADMLIQAVDAASLVGTNRLGTCPLTKYACIIFADNNIPAIIRLNCFYLWCARRSIDMHTKAFSFHRDMIEIFDYRIHELCLKLADGNQSGADKMVDWYVAAFQHFDNCDKEQAETKRWVRVLSTGVVRFILENEPDSNSAREGTISSGLPVGVLIEIHNAIAQVLNRTLGLSLKIGSNVVEEDVNWDEIIEPDKK